MSKPRRQCIFCDNPVDSKEHLWSEWMHPLIGDEPSSKHNRHTITKWRDGREQMEGPSDRSGGAIKIQIRAVCRSCNSGWMNRIEGGVRPFLDEMILGNPITLNQNQITVLAKWCAMKFIVMEHAQRDTAVTPDQDRRALKENGMIPAFFRIYVGNHASEARSGLLRSSHCIATTAEGPNPPLIGTTKNIETTTMLVGRIFIHLNAARLENFEIEHAFSVSRVWDECRIWPTPPIARKWPHRPLLSDDGLFTIAGALDAIRSSPKTTWVNDDL